MWWFGKEDLASFSGPGVPTDCCHLLHLRCSSARGGRLPAWSCLGSSRGVRTGLEGGAVKEML